MVEARGKVIKSGRDAKGRPRKFIEITEFYYNDFDFGDFVSIKKLAKQESG